jgi:hypothetical protein
MPLLSGHDQSPERARSAVGVPAHGTPELFAQYGRSVDATQPQRRRHRRHGPSQWDAVAAGQPGVVPVDG